MNTSVIFCLARGYRNIHFYKYFKLCLRNLAIKRVFGNSLSSFDQIIFHEGNIRKSQQFFIRFLSMNHQLKFICIASDFALPPSQLQSVENPGYVAMCRFQYAFVWKWIMKYEKAIRIDDDVIMLRFDFRKEVEVFDHAFISNETHLPTNRSLGEYLESTGHSELYDHKFPYTNFYVTNTSFWLIDEIQDFLQEIASRDEGIRDRWGDATVLGIALKLFKQWEKVKLRKDVVYFHLSHRSIVRNGINESILHATSLKFPWLVKVIRKTRQLFY